jgi:hypothetical protein
MSEIKWSKKEIIDFEAWWLKFARHKWDETEALYDGDRKYKYGFLYGYRAAIRASKKRGK